VQKRVDSALAHNAPHWRIQNLCYCCNYKVSNLFLPLCTYCVFTLLAQGRSQISPQCLSAIDGNNSAKRVRSAGMHDLRQFHSDYFLTRDEVNKFKDKVRHAAHDAPDNADAPWLSDSCDSGDPADSSQGRTPCTDRWKSSPVEHEKRRWISTMPRTLRKCLPSRLHIKGM